MDSFAGHAIPGSFFFLFGVWWTINIFRQFFGSRGKSAIPYRSQPWYPGPFGAKFPAESGVKIVAATISIAMELATIAMTDPSHSFNRNAYHITMFSFFALNGVTDLLSYKGYPFPEGIEVASGLLALGVEGFLLSSHVTDGRPMLDIKVHAFIIYAVVGIALSIFFEIRYRDSVLPSLTRAFFTLLHGTWLIQVGFIVSPPFSGMQQWDMMDHGVVMWAPLFFAWHLMSNFVFMLLMQVGVWSYLKRCHQLDDVRYKLIASEMTMSA